MVPEKVFPTLMQDLNREQHVLSCVTTAIEAIESMRQSRPVRTTKDGETVKLHGNFVYGRVAAYDDLIELLNTALTTAHKQRADRLTQDETGVLISTPPDEPLGLMIKELESINRNAAILRPTLGPMPEATVSIDRTQILEMAKDWSARMIEQFRDHEDLKPNPRNIEAVFRHFEDLVTKPAPVAADADGGQ